MTRRTLVPAALAVATAVAAAGLLVGSRAAEYEPPGPVAPSATDPGGAVATAPTRASTDAPYALWGTNPDGTPVRWDPCTPITWVIDDSMAPAGARELVSLAVARIAAATGLEFVHGGIVREDPSRGRSLVVDGPDGRSWAPVLVTWVPGGSTDLPLGDRERGVAVPVAVRDGGPRVFVTGQVVLNSDRRLLPGFEDRHASWGAVVLHELAHLVGLDHVDDPAQLMHPAPGFGPVELAAGDLAGLAAVGADGGCLPQPEPRELEVSFD